MKVTIDFDDFWLDEDSGDLKSELKSYVVMQTKAQIWNKIKDEVKTALVNTIRSKVETSIELEVRKYVEELYNSEEIYIKEQYSNSEPIPFKAYVKKRITSKVDTTTVKSFIEDKAKEHVKSLKASYDLQFAAHVVSKMQEQGMLKEDILKKLTTEK